jgi:hypothetical protein
VLKPATIPPVSAPSVYPGLAEFVGGFPILVEMSELERSTDYSGVFIGGPAATSESVAPVIHAPRPVSTPTSSLELCVRRYRRERLSVTNLSVGPS